MDEINADRIKKAAQTVPGNTGFERFMDMHKESRGAKRMSGKGQQGWRYTEGPYKGMTPQAVNRIAHEQWRNMPEDQRDTYRPKTKGDYAAEAERRKQSRREDFKEETRLERKRRRQLGISDPDSAAPPNVPGGRTSRPDFSKPSGGATPENELGPLARKELERRRSEGQKNLSEEQTSERKGRKNKPKGRANKPKGRANKPINMPVSTSSPAPVSTPSPSPVSNPQSRGMIDGMPAKEAIRQATERVERMRAAAPKKSMEEYQRDMQSSRVDLAEKRQKEAERARIDSMRNPEERMRKRVAAETAAEAAAKREKELNFKREQREFQKQKAEKESRKAYLNKAIKDKYGSVDKAPVNVGYGFVMDEKTGKARDMTPEDFGAPSYDDYIKKNPGGEFDSRGRAAEKPPVKSARRPGPRSKRF